MGLPAHGRQEGLRETHSGACTQDQGARPHTAVGSMSGQVGDLSPSQERALAQVSVAGGGGGESPTRASVSRSAPGEGAPKAPEVPLSSVAPGLFPTLRVLETSVYTSTVQ